VQNCGRSESKTFTVEMLFIFEGNKTHLRARNELGTVVIVGGSNIAEAWGQIPQPSGANVGSEAEPQPRGDFYSFFFK